MSARATAIVSALLLAAFLVLRPLASGLGAPQVPDVRGSGRLHAGEGSAEAAVAGEEARAAARSGLVGGGPPAPATVPSSAPGGGVATRPGSRSAPGPEHAAESAAIERLIFARTNVERRSAGCSDLLPDETLAAVARAHSADMLRRGFFEHINLDGARPEDRVAAAHRRLIGLVSENIWQGTGLAAGEAAGIADEIVRGWMRSPGHRENILRRESTHLGVGLAWAGGELLATQDFAEARAFLDVPLPLAVTSGGAVSLLVRPFPAKGAEAQEFDLWSAARGLRAFPPAPLAGAHLAAGPGAYQIRFYFPLPTAGRLAIIPGPRVEVR
jgi:uncharacterized protein YkwD